MEITITLSQLIEVLVFVAALAMVWGAVRSDVHQLKRDYDGLEKRLGIAEISPQRVGALEMRIASVEGLAAKVDRIDPLIERVTQFERHMGEKVDGLARTLDDLRTLLFKAAAKSGA